MIFYENRAIGVDSPISDMAELFKEERSVFEKQLRDAFKPAAGSQQSDLFRAIALVFYHNEKLSDIYEVYKLLGVEDFVRLIHIFDGRTIRFPTSAELKEAVILSLCFYYREVEGLTWEEVHDKIPFKFSSLTVSYKLKSLNAAIRAELTEIFKDQRRNMGNRK
jgi:hypothetical protein